MKIFHFSYPYSAFFPTRSRGIVCNLGFNFGGVTRKQRASGL